MKFVEAIIPGCYEIHLQRLEDLRGGFVKTFHEQMFKDQGLESRFTEEYYSVSKQGVLRGLHFQLPPYAHNKLVYCVKGQVLDVVVDLRVGSPTYAKTASFDLSANNANMIYIPKGMAHGIYVVSDTAIIVCKTSTIFAPLYDTGIFWQSINIWPTDKPILSDKDKSLPLLSDFVSPFRYQET